MGMSVSTSSAENEPMMEINTTPLIDVMLVLLVMLIVTLPPQTHAVKLDMPVPNENPTPPLTPPTVVDLFVDFDGTYLWNGETVSREFIAAQFEQIGPFPVAQQPELHIRPHALAEYGYVAAVMADAQRNGVQKIGVIGGAS